MPVFSRSSQGMDSARRVTVVLAPYRLAGGEFHFSYTSLCEMGPLGFRAECLCPLCKNIWPVVEFQLRARPFSSIERVSPNHEQDSDRFRVCPSKVSRFVS